MNGTLKLNLWNEDNIRSQFLHFDENSIESIRINTSDPIIFEVVDNGESLLIENLDLLAGESIDISGIGTHFIQEFVFDNNLGVTQVTQEFFNWASSNNFQFVNDPDLLSLSSSLVLSEAITINQNGVI